MYLTFHDQFLINKHVCFFFFAVHYSSEPLNNLFRGMDGHIHFQFQGQASLYSDGSSLEHDALIFVGGERT